MMKHALLLMAGAVALAVGAATSPQANASNEGSARIKVACLGDSITVGSQCSDRKTKSYPAVLQKLLGDGYEVKKAIRAK